MKKYFFPLFLMTLCLPAFASYTMDNLLNLLRLNNAELVKASEEISKAKMDVLDAKAGFYPTIDFTVTGSYIANPIDPIRVNIGDYAGSSLYGLSGNDYLTLYNGMEKTYYSFQVQLTQPLFTWGKLDNALKLYEQIYDIRTLQYKDVYEKLVTELNTRTAVLYYLDKILDVLDENRNLSKRLSELADSAYENGMMLKSEALSVKVKAGQIDVAYEQLKREKLLMETSIAKLVGLKSFSSDELSISELELQTLISETSAEQLSYYLDLALSDNRTNIAMLYGMNNIAEYSKKISDASVNWKPDIALVVNAGYGGSRFPLVETDWYGQDDWNLIVTLAIKTTLFDGGKAVRNTERAKSDIIERNADTFDNKALIRSTVTDNYSSMTVSIARQDYLNSCIRQYDEEILVKKELYNSGYGSESDYISLLIEKNGCVIEKLQEMINLITSVYTLRYLTGSIGQ